MVGERIHGAALAAVLEYARIRLTSVRAYPQTLPAEAEGILNTVWLIYILALRMAYGVLPASVNEIASERLHGVLREARKALERELKRRRIRRQLPKAALGDLRGAEEFARHLAGFFSAKLKAAPHREFPQVPGTVYLLLSTNPTVLMRRAIIAQLLKDRPDCSQKDMCGRLDHHSCAIPDTWRGTGVIDWRTSHRSPSLRRRLKKLLSDDVDELRKWGAV